MTLSDDELLAVLANCRLAGIRCTDPDEVSLRLQSTDFQRGSTLYLLDGIVMQCRIDANAQLGKIVCARVHPHLNPRTSEEGRALWLDFETGQLVIAFHEWCAGSRWPRQVAHG